MTNITQLLITQSTIISSKKSPLLAQIMKPFSSL